MRRIENIEELIAHLDGYQTVELRTTLKICKEEYNTIEKIKKLLLDTCLYNTNNLGMHYENMISAYYTIYEIDFTEEFQDDVYYRNREWIDILLFLFQLYGYEYIFDYWEEIFILQIPQYVDFFTKLDVFIDPYYGEQIGNLFFYENEKKIDALYQKERRKDKSKNIVARIKDRF